MCTDIRTNLCLLIFLLFVAVVFIHPVYAGWVLPTGYSDPGNQWTTETRAYDDNTGTYASNNYGGTGWGQYIYFTLSSSIYCDRVRVFSDFGYGHVDQVQIDIYDGSWHNVYTGTVNDCAWTEISFTGYNNVTQGRYRFHYSAGGWYFWLYEFQFWSGTPPTLPSCQTDAATSVEETTAILHGQVTDDGGQPCEYRFQYGLTASYGNNTAWEGSKMTGDNFSKLITGLSPGNTYHFRAQVKNSAGISSGSDMTFFTGAPSSTWVSATGNSDPNGQWEYEELAYDDDTATYARCNHAIGAPQWSPFLYLTHNTITSNKIRFWARGNTGDTYYVDSVDVDVHVNGSWVDVYQGSFADKTWVEKTFTQGTVDQARIRFHVNSSNAGLYFELYEFDFYRVSSNAPTLAWTGETNYVSDGLDPEIGCSNTPFEFRVQYTDADGDAPSYIRVYIDKNGDGDYVDTGEVIDMSLASDSAASQHDGDYTNGEVFTATTTIHYGPNTNNCSYYFAASDGTFTATGPPTTSINAPDVVKGIYVTAGDANPGDTNETPYATGVEMLQVKFKTDDIEDVKIKSLQLTPSGTGHDVNDLPSGAVQIYRDENNNGIYDPSVDTFIYNGNFSGDDTTTTFDIPDQTIAKNSEENWLVVYDFSSSYTDVGDTFRVTLSPSGVSCEGVDSGDSFTGYGDTVTGGLKTIQSGTGSLTVSAGPHNPSDSTALNNAQDVEMLQVSLTASDVEDINISSITFTASGTIDDSTDITDVELWKDIDDDGVLNTSVDTQIGTAQVYSSDNGTVTFSGLSQTISAGSTENWLVVYDLAGTAIDGDTASVQLASNSDVTATGASSGNSITPTGAPVVGQTLTISNIGTLTISVGDNSSSDSNENASVQDMEMLQLKLSANDTENIQVTSITFTASGTADDSVDITRVQLFKDVNNNGVYDVGTDTQIDGDKTYSTDDGTVTFSGLSETITASSTQNWLVVYDLAGSASNNETFTVRLANNNDVSATGQTSGQPANVSGAPVVGCTKTISTTGSITLAAGPSNPGDSNESPDAQDVEMLQFTFQTSDVEGVTVNSITLVPSGTGHDVNDLPSGAVQIAIDENHDGIYQSTTDTLLTTGDFSGDDTPTTFTVNHTVPQGTTEYWLVFYDFNSSVTDNGDTFSVKLQPTGVSATGQTSGNPITCGGSTAQGGTKTISSTVGSLSLAGGANNPSDGHISASASDLEMLQLSLTASDVENINISSITFTASGTADDSTDITNVRLYLDVNNNGVYDSGTDTQIGTSQTYSSDDGTVTFSGLTETINAGSTENWLVVYNLAGSASSGETFQVRFASNTHITATGASSSQNITPTGAPVSGGVMTISSVPALDWTGETGYVSDGVDPEVGYSSTTFTFRVKYTDADNDAPSYIRVYIDKNGDGDYGDPGEVNDMSAVDVGDTDYTDGKIYTYSTTIPYGPNTDNCSYYFAANDGTYNATGAPTSPINAPDVLQTLSVSVSPSSYNFGFVDAGTYVTSTSSITVTNDGDGDEDYKLQITSKPAGWTTVETASDPGNDEYKLLAMFNSTAPGDTFVGDAPAEGTDDIIFESSAKNCDSTNFSGDENGDDVAPSADRHLWLRFGAPSSTSVLTQQTITVTIEAFASSEF